MSVVYEDNQVDPSKVGKTKSIYEQDVEEVTGRPKQPSYNPEVVDENITSSTTKQRKQNSSPNSTENSKNNLNEFKNTIETSTPNYKKSIILFVIFLISLFVGVWYYNLSAIKTEKVMIFDTIWERQVHLQENKLVTKEGWELPTGATVLRTKREIYKYNEISEDTGREICTEKLEKVPSHKEYSHTNTKIKEDGSVIKKDNYKTIFKNNIKTYCYPEKILKKVPEFRTKYYYQIFVWTDLEPLITKGNGRNMKPYFAKYREDKTHKISKKVSIYKIRFEKLDSGKLVTYKANSKFFKIASKNVKRECIVDWNYFDLKNLKC